jgi:hypothetical protein
MLKGVAIILLVWEMVLCSFYLSNVEMSDYLNGLRLTPSQNVELSVHAKANVYIIHSVHMILTQAELLAASNWLWAKGTLHSVQFPQSLNHINDTIRRLLGAFQITVMSIGLEKLGLFCVPFQKAPSVMKGSSFMDLEPYFHLVTRPLAFPDSWVCPLDGNTSTMRGRVTHPSWNACDGV